MNHIIETTRIGSIPASELSDWALSHGITSLSTEEVMHLCGLPANQVSQRMASLRKRGKLFSPARGLWVPIPPEYRTWGAPDPMNYIDDMMAHLGADYLVGWLTAAERHGAGHHAAQVFQVATGKTVRARAFGRSRLEFYTRGYVGPAAESADLLRKTGVRVASPGTTMLMLAADPGICGGVSNVANLVVELAEEHAGFSTEAITDAPLFPDTAARRLGWLLDTFGDGSPDGLAGYCASLTSEPSFLSPSSARTGKLDAKLRIVVNEEVDPDI
jgi:predicted transcriptional regulator of viral defense system